MHMGSYGIGPTRLVAAIIEASHDEQRHHLAGGGRALRRRAPQPEGRRRRRPTRPARAIYTRADARPASTCSTTTATSGRARKFATADLIGLPWQVVVGPKGLAEGKVELKRRADGRARDARAARRRRSRALDEPSVGAHGQDGGSARRHLQGRALLAFEWMLAGRYLRTRRREGFVSVIAGFSFLGIMLGVATLIVVMSVMNGFRNELLDKIVGINGHIFVRRSIRPLTDYRGGRRRASPSVPGVHARDADGRGPGASAPRNTTAAACWCAACAAEDMAQDRRHRRQHAAGHARRFRRRRAASPSAAASPRRCRCRSATRMTLITPRGAHDALRHRAAHQGLSGRRRSSRSACRSSTRPSSIMPLQEAQAYFNRGRRRHRHRGLPRQCRPASSRRAPRIERGGRPADGADRLAPAQPDLLRRARGRAQRHVPDPDADRARRGAQHHLRPDHAGEGQVERHRHPAHHGRDARRHHAHLPHHRRLDRHRRHARRLPARPAPHAQRRDDPATSSPGCTSTQPVPGRTLFPEPAAARTSIRPRS